MTGWKTKVGALLVSLGEVLVQSVPEYEWVGRIIEGIGGGLIAWGLGHKIEKATVALKLK